GSRLGIAMAGAGAATRGAVTEVPGIAEAGFGVRRARIGSRACKGGGHGGVDGRWRREAWCGRDVSDADAAGVVGVAAQTVGDAAAYHDRGGAVVEVRLGDGGRGAGAAGDFEGAVVVEVVAVRVAPRTVGRVGEAGLGGGAPLARRGRYG